MTFSPIESGCVCVPLDWMEPNLISGFIPDMVRVISCGFPAAAAEHEADASACVRLELLIVSVISWPLVLPDKSPDPPMTWLRSCAPAECTWKQCSLPGLVKTEGSR